MIKRLFQGLLLLGWFAFLSVLTLILWQPDALKTRLLNALAERATVNTPYDVKIKQVSGNILKTLTLTRARLFSKTDHAELIQLQILNISFNVRALWHRRLETALNGRLADGPFVATAVASQTGIESLNCDWTKPGVGQAKAHLAYGKGPFEVHVSTHSFKAVITGMADLPHKQVYGQGRLSDVPWQGKQVKGLQFSFFYSADRQDLIVSALLPFVHLTLHGKVPQWHYTTYGQYKNVSFHAAGRLIQEKDNAWRLTWRQLVLVFPAAGSWKAAKSGYLLWRKSEVLQIHDLSLANGSQSLEIPHALWQTKGYECFMSAKQIDPTPWAVLFMPGLSIESGHFNASLNVRGKKSPESVDGFVTAQAKSVQYIPTGFALQNLDVNVQSEHKTWTIKQFSGVMKKGELHLSGGGNWPNIDCQLTVRSLSLQASGITALGDIALRIQGTPSEPDLSGTINIQRGSYTTSKSSSTSKASSAFWPPLTMDIALEWPRDVWYRDGVTGIETRADLHIRKARGKTDPTLTGTISSVRGTYNYYGRDFNIDSAELQFPGTTGFNPLMNIEASYRSDPTMVYLDITGTFDKPTLKLRSNPPLSEQDIVSVIVFGQPLSQLRSHTGGQTTNQEMMQAAGGVLGSYVTKGLRQMGVAELHVDVLNFQPTQEGSQLTIGRYLTRRLFVSYGQTVRGSAEKSLTADYFLTDKWTLQGASNSTEGNYLDFLFRYPLKKGSTTNASPLPNSPFRNTLDQPNPQQPSFMR
jgi:hypothetical protein